MTFDLYIGEFFCNFYVYYINDISQRVSERDCENEERERNKGWDREREKVYLVHLQIVVITNELLRLLIIIIIIVTDYTMIIIIIM